MIRAATSLRQGEPGGTIASKPGRASGAVMTANEPGAPTAGIVRGARPASPAAWSARPSAVARSATRGGTTRSAARPSANGHCETTAAIEGSCAATATTWPPENDVPKSPIRCASMPASVRANATAAW